jgi:hypothetical protein
MTATLLAVRHGQAFEWVADISLIGIAAGWIEGGQQYRISVHA